MISALRQRLLEFIKMLRRVLLAVLALNILLFIRLASPSPSTSKQYRKDYVYNKETDAFYKLHIEGSAAVVADEKCAAEGAHLVPIGPQDLIQVHAMFKRFPDLGEHVIVASDGTHHETTEDPPLISLGEDYDSSSSVQSYPNPNLNVECDVVNREGEVVAYSCFRALPFACKVDAKDAPYNEECDVYSKNYVSKLSVTGSCYSISTKKANWNEAYANCQAEGADLVVVNNDVELQVLKDLIQGTPRSVEDWQFFVGVRAETRPYGREFLTVHNQTLEQVGYAPWDNNEPNNEYGMEFCVSLLKRTGKYNDTVCNNRYVRNIIIIIL